MKNPILKTSILLMMIFISQSICFAQYDRESKNPHFGFKGGLNLSNLYFKNAEDTKQILGYNVGVFVKIPITEFLAIQPEFYLTTKGAEVTYNNLFVDGTARFTSNYIEVPLLVVANITENFNIHIGPYVSYLLSGKVTNAADIHLFDFEKNINTHDFNEYETGLAAGVGFEFGAVGIGARYNYGFTKIGKEKTYMGTTYTFPDAENAVLNFYFTILLN